MYEIELTLNDKHQLIQKKKVISMYLERLGLSILVELEKGEIRLILRVVLLFFRSCDFVK